MHRCTEIRMIVWVINIIIVYKCNLKQPWSYIGAFVCYQNIDAKKKKLNLHNYGFHILNPQKTVENVLSAQQS